MNVEVYHNTSLKSLIESKSKHSDPQPTQQDSEAIASARVFDIDVNFKQLQEYASAFMHQLLRRQNNACSGLGESGLNCKFTIYANRVAQRRYNFY